MQLSLGHWHCWWHCSPGQHSSIPHPRGASPPYNPLQPHTTRHPLRGRPLSCVYSINTFVHCFHRWPAFSCSCSYFFFAHYSFILWARFFLFFFFQIARIYENETGLASHTKKTDKQAEGQTDGRTDGYSRVRSTRGAKINKRRKISRSSSTQQSAQKV